MYGYFTPGSQIYNEEGGEILKRPRDLAAARAAIRQAGCNNEPLVLLAAQDFHSMKAASEVSAGLFRQLGPNVEVVATDFATIATPRGNKGPISQGGWSAFSATHAGTDCISPASCLGLRANGERAWFDAPDLETEKVDARRLNADALEHVVFVPTGFFLNKQAWRTSLDGVVAGPLPVFRDVTERS